MALLTPVTPARAANLLAAVAADPLGDKFPNGGKELLVLEHTNAEGADVTLTLVTTATVDGEDVTDKEIEIVKGTRHVIGPFPKNVYNDAEGRVSLTYSAAADVTVAVISP